jgi:hypothetical protein
MRFRTPFWLPFGALVAVAGCEKEQHEKPAAPAASVDKAAAIDPALAKAVAAASAGVGAGAAPAGSGQPPPGGIFPPGGADRELPAGSPPKLTVGSTGGTPKVQLGPVQPKPGFKTTANFDVAVQADARQGALPITFATTLEASKPKTEAAAGAAPEPVTISVKVTGAKLGISGAPVELESRVAKLKGLKLEYEVAANGAASPRRYALPAGSEDLRDHVKVLSDTLALVTLPVPAEPVGVGAMWMVASREGVFGLDLVTYRLVKVEAVSGDAATLSVATKRYATSNRFDFEGLPPEAPHQLAEFESKADGKLVLKAGAPLPSSADLDSGLTAQLAMPGQQRGVIQIQSRVALDLGKR